MDVSNAEQQQRQEQHHVVLSSASSSNNSDERGGSSASNNNMALLGFVPGAVGGFCNVFVGHPADLVKVRQQCGGSSAASVPAPTSMTPPATTAVGSTTAASSNVFLPNNARGGASAMTMGSAGNGKTANLSTAAAAALRIRIPSPHTVPTSTARTFPAVMTTKKPLAPTSSTSTFGMFRTILATEGVAGLYAGITAPLLAVVPAYGVAFWSFDMAAKAITTSAASRQSSINKNKNNDTSTQNNEQQLSIRQTAMAGAFSGFTVALFLGPLEKIKCEFQMNPKKYSGFGDCVRQSYYQPGGVGGGSSSSMMLFRGTGCTIVRDVPGNAVFFATYEFVKRTLTDDENEYKKSSTLTTLLAGGLAGTANWVVALPADVIKSRWQVSTPGQYSSPADVLKQLLHREGPRALFRGLGPALLRAFPANAAALLGVETARSVLGRLDQ